MIRKKWKTSACLARCLVDVFISPSIPSKPVHSLVAESLRNTQVTRKVAWYIHPPRLTDFSSFPTHREEEGKFLVSVSHRPVSEIGQYKRKRALRNNISSAGPYRTVVVVNQLPLILGRALNFGGTTQFTFHDCHRVTYVYL